MVPFLLLLFPLLQSNPTEVCDLPAILPPKYASKVIHADCGIIPQSPKFTRNCSLTTENNYTFLQPIKTTQLLLQCIANRTNFQSIKVGQLQTPNLCAKPPVVPSVFAAFVRYENCSQPPTDSHFAGRCDAVLPKGYSFLNNQTHNTIFCLDGILSNHTLEVQMTNDWCLKPLISPPIFSNEFYFEDGCEESLDRYFFLGNCVVKTKQSYSFYIDNTLASRVPLNCHNGAVFELNIVGNNCSKPQIQPSAFSEFVDYRDCRESPDGVFFSGRCTVSIGSAPKELYLKSKENVLVKNATIECGEKGTALPQKLSVVEAAPYCPKPNVVPPENEPHLRYVNCTRKSESDSTFSGRCTLQPDANYSLFLEGTKFENFDLTCSPEGMASSKSVEVWPSYVSQSCPRPVVAPPAFSERLRMDQCITTGSGERYFGNCTAVAEEGYFIDNMGVFENELELQCNGEISRVFALIVNLKKGCLVPELKNGRYLKGCGGKYHYGKCIYLCERSYANLYGKEFIGEAECRSDDSRNKSAFDHPPSCRRHSAFVSTIVLVALVFLALSFAMALALIFFFTAQHVFKLISNRCSSVLYY